MNRRLGSALGALVVLTCATSSALADVQREDVIVLNANGRDFTSYKTLRSDLSQRLLYLDADEPPEQAMYIVPSDYKVTKLADGASRLLFSSGSYAIMNTGRFDSEVSRADNGDLVFASWDGVTRSDGHLGKWNSPDDFDSFAYSWIVPANIKIVSYRANRPGEWDKRGETLSWHGEQVNDIAFTIRYRVEDTASAAPSIAPTEPTPAATPERAPEPTLPLPLPKRQRMSAPTAELETAPPAPMSEQRTASETPATRPAATTTTPASADPGPRSIRLASIVILANGKPLITARGHVVLDRLAATLDSGKADTIVVTGPHIANSRDTGGSAAQAARVADYLGTHGVDGGIDIRPGDVQGSSDGREVEITVTPGSALADFSAGE